MKKFLLGSLAALLPSVALAGGVTNPSGISLASASALISQMAIPKTGGDITTTKFTVPGSTAAQTTSAGLSTTVNAKLFGAYGDVVQLGTTAAAASGATTLTFASTAGLVVGGVVVSGYASSGTPYIQAGTTVSALTSTTVTLSQALVGAIPVNALIDFPQHDDSTAINTAQMQAARQHASVYYPPGRYYAPSANAFAGTSVLDGASLSANSGVSGAADQSQVQGLLGQGLVYQFNSPGQENGQYLSGVFNNTNVTSSYQKNLQSIRATNNDLYLKHTDPTTGAVTYSTHDAVASFIVMQQPATNTLGNSWNNDWVLGLDAGSNGSAVVTEQLIQSHRTTESGDADGLNVVGGTDEIYNCQNECLYAHFFQGNTFTDATKPGLVDGLLFRKGATENIEIGDITADYNDTTTTYGTTYHTTNWAVYSNGMGFFQTLHIGGGTTHSPKHADIIPTAGFGVDLNGNATGPSFAANGAVSGSTVSAASTLSAPGFSVGPNANGAVTLGSSSATTTPLIDFLQDGNGDSCRILGGGGSNLDFMCGTVASGLNNLLVMYSTGMAFNVAPKMAVGASFGSTSQSSFTNAGVLNAISAVVGGGAAQSGYAQTVNGNSYISGNETVVGNLTAPTPTAGDNSTKVATTAFASGAISTATAPLAPKANPTLSNATLTGSDRSGVLGKSAAFTYDATMHTIEASTAGGAFNATLPACVTAISGTVYDLNKYDASTNAVTLTAASGNNAQTGVPDTIGGAATVSLTTQHTTLTVKCDGAGYWIRGASL